MNFRTVWQKKNLNREARFVFLFISLTALLLVLVFASSVIVDPWGLFGTGLIKPLALADRTDKLARLVKMNPTPELIILGSSRAFYINPELAEKLTGLKTFNASVGFARSEEYYALSRYIIEKLQIKPKIFFVAFNIAEFNYDTMDAKTVNNSSLRPYLNLNKITYFKIILRTFKDTINLQYLGDIFKTLFYNVRGYPKTALAFIDNGYVDVTRHPARREGAKRRHELKPVIKLFKNMPGVSPMRQEYFEKFLRFSRDNDIKIVSVILPMPNEILEVAKRETTYNKAYADLLVYLGNLSQAYPFAYYDFSSIDTFNGLEENFGDPTHPGAINLDLITTKVFEKYMPHAKIR